MKIKKISILLLLLSLPFFIFPEHVSFAEAQTSAQNWTKILRHTFNNRVTGSAGEKILREGVEVAYVFHFSPRGYVVISAEDYLPPIKLYSLNNDFGKEGQALEEIVFSQYHEIITKVKAAAINPDTFFSTKNRTNFKLLQRGFKSKNAPCREAAYRPPTRVGFKTAAPGLPPRISFTTGASEAAPLLTTTWHQRAPYNLKCPEIDGELPPSGCVATAFAQVMKYFSYPEIGHGSWSYTTRTLGIHVTAYFDHPYYWEQMMDDYPQTDPGTAEQRDAVAELTFDVGAALEMNYTLDGSGAYPALAVFNFPKLFKYSRDILYVSRAGWNDAEWFALAKAQVERGIPVILGIARVDAGHLVVIDGYRISSGADTFHLNMGWGGTWDGYYSLNNIVIATREYTLTEFQNYVINLVPPDSGIELPAQDIGIAAYENRSLLFKEYACELTWKGPPAGQGNVEKYEIISYDTIYGFYDFVAEVNAPGPDGIYKYSFRMADYTAYAYIVQVVYSDGTKEPVMLCHPILRN